MKGILLCIVIVGLVAVVKGQHLNLNDVRKDFNKGVKDQDLCEKHLDVLEKHAKTSVEKGYEAAFHMFMAKHTGNPIKKMSYFNGGKKMLEKQIKIDPNNIELRFIRLCIQYYIPTYLGYRDNIEQDKDFLVSNLYKLNDEKTKDVLYNYLKGAKMYTDQELVQLGR
ncbi:hypothetical protein SAMN05660841_02586 [Sphingobacterium nematocida]|uniref:Uncharacterized protein n=1 Tax=Sphingobacterium nematocida TaxID=1513896 RepID=A0A1T5EHF9_9SPHI|nr:hypothetical protein [Sphingobacterium nematocida]SKB83394.1 hypothetical protein SAMN05660841_02586 [Sphingobacterium nematocida]